MSFTNINVNSYEASPTAIEKVCQKTGKVLGEWSSLGEAAEMNLIWEHRMKRAVKNRMVFKEGDLLIFYREKV